MKYLLPLTIALFIALSLLSVAYGQTQAALLKDHEECINDFNDCRELLKSADKTLEKCEKIVSEKCPTDYKTPVATGGGGCLLGIIFMFFILL